MTLPLPNVRNESEVNEYFARLEKEHPELVEAMKVMNVSYRQYLEALLSLSGQSSFSTSSARLTI